MATEAQARAVLAARRAELMALPYVEGVALTQLDGEACILVLLNRKPRPEEWLPSYLDGVRLITRVSGRIMPV